MPPRSEGLVLPPLSGCKLPGAGTRPSRGSSAVPSTVLGTQRELKSDCKQVTNFWGGSEQIAMVVPLTMLAGGSYAPEGLTWKKPCQVQAATFLQMGSGYRAKESSVPGPFTPCVVLTALCRRPVSHCVEERVEVKVKAQSSIAGAGGQVGLLQGSSCQMPLLWS